MDWFWTFYVFIIGLCIGSFLNVVVLRGFSGESIVLPPSHCTKCNHKLAWYDNIPLISYILLKGKCRYCNKKISIQYPIVEFSTGIIFALLYYKYSFGTFNLNFLFLTICASLCIAMTTTDFKEKVIFDGHAYILVIVGLIYNFFNFAGENFTKIGFWAFGHKISIYQSFIDSILGLIGGFGLLFLITKISKLITKRDCFGEGDAYILGALGAFFGIVNTIIILILSIFIWGGLSIPIFLYKWVKNGEYKLFATVLLFMISAILFFLGTIFDIFTNQTFLWFTYLLVASLGLRSCWLILNSIKQGNQLTVIPFGPALVFGAFVVMFLL